MKKLIEKFNPAWGAAVMGTGITSIVSYKLGEIFKWVSLVLFIINSIFLLYSLIFWILMWIITPKKVSKTLNNPTAIVFIPTVPIGVIVYVSNLMAIKKSFFQGIDPVVLTYAWFIVSIIIVVLSIHFFYKMFSHPNIEIQHSTYGWLIPPVALLVIPLGGINFYNYFPAWGSKFLIVFSLIGCGSGLFAYLFVNSAVTHRYFFHELPLKQMTPTIWIGLGPIGAIVAVFIGFGRIFTDLTALSNFGAFSIPFAVLFWGFGVIWYFISILLTLHKTFFEEIPYSMGWWAFTFPLGIFTLSTYQIYKILMQSKFVLLLFYLFYITLLFSWLLTFYRTFKYHLWEPKNKDILEKRELKNN